MNPVSTDRKTDGRFFSASLKGFFLSLTFTGLAFGLVLNSGPHATWLDYTGIFVLALIQIPVHLHYFLHLDFSKKSGWHLAALMFTLFIMGLFVAGTFWIMLNLNSRMM